MEPGQQPYQGYPPQTPYPGQAPPPPMGYFPPMQAPRPTGVTVLAVIGFCLGGLAAINHGLGLLMIASNGSSPVAPMPWPMIDSGISLTFAVVLIVLCIGFLRQSPSARRMSRIWAGAYLGWLAICVVVAVTWILPMTVRRFQGPQAETMRIAAYVGAVAVLAIAAIYPTFVLIFMGKPQIEGWFEGSSATASAAPSPYAPAPLPPPQWPQP